MKTDSHTTLRLLTPDEMADLLRISKSTLYRLIEKRKIPFYKVEGSLRFLKRDIVSYLDKNRVDSVF